MEQQESTLNPSSNADLEVDQHLPDGDDVDVHTATCTQQLLITERENDFDDSRYNPELEGTI